MISDRMRDWKEKALQADILAEAVARGAKLKRAGREWTGPCPACGGTDRFSINIQKRIFNCRGSEGGDVIALVMHVDGVSFQQACEVLTGEPPPGGQARPLSAAEQAERDERRATNERAQRQREAEQERYQDNTREAAQAIWDAAVPIKGTVAERYLLNRGLIEPLGGWPEALRFERYLKHPNGGRFQGLVARVDDVAGELTAVWRIYLTTDGYKADVENPKLGLGPAAGGAVRLGGTAARIGIAEGVETALGAMLMHGCRFPVWAGLSTAGVQNVEIPLGIERVVAFPDGDLPVKREKDALVTVQVPPGRRAAQELKNRLNNEGIPCALAAEPPGGMDYLDLWVRSRAEVA